MTSRGRNFLWIPIRIRMSRFWIRAIILGSIGGLKRPATFWGELDGQKDIYLTPLQQGKQMCFVSGRIERTKCRIRLSVGVSLLKIRCHPTPVTPAHLSSPKLAPARPSSTHMGRQHMLIYEGGSLACSLTDRGRGHQRKEFIVDFTKC